MVLNFWSQINWPLPPLSLLILECVQVKNHKNLYLNRTLGKFMIVEHAFSRFVPAPHLHFLIWKIVIHHIWRYFFNELYFYWCDEREIVWKGSIPLANSELEIDKKFSSIFSRYFQFSYYLHTTRFLQILHQFFSKFKQNSKITSTSISLIFHLHCNQQLIIAQTSNCIRQSQCTRKLTKNTTDCGENTHTSKILAPNAHFVG